MKTSDFISENHHIVQAVVEMHDDHEIQMAREQCYNAASNAIELHRMLKQITERQGLEGWVQEKITLASDYLRQVKEWMEHDLAEKMTQDHAVISSPLGETVSAGGTSSGSFAVSTAVPYAKRKKTNEVDLSPPSPPQVPKDQVPAYLRKRYGGKDWKTGTKDLANRPFDKNLISHPDVLRKNIGAIK